MKASRLLLRAALAALLVLGPLASTSSGALAQTRGIVAIANDQPITDLDITQRVTLLDIVGDLPPGGLTKQQALQALIDDQVKIVEATRLAMLPTDSDVTDRIDKLAQGMKISRADLLAKLKAKGISEASFRRYVQASMGFNRIISAKYRQDMDATDAEVDAKIAEIKSKVGAQMSKLMNDPRMKPITVYTLMEIKLPVDGQDPMLLQSRAIEAQQVMQRLKGCGSVKAASDGIFNVKPGKTFDADAAKLPKPMRAALDKVGKGRAVGPMRGKEGIQLIALCAVRTITPPKPDFTMPTREQVKRIVVNEKYDKIEQDYLKVARDKIYVEYRDQSYAQQ